MAVHKDWWPEGRRKQLELMKRWMNVLTSDEIGSDGKPTGRKKWQAWGIPSEVFAAFAEAYGRSVGAFDEVILSGSRAGPLNKECQEAFAELEKQGRFLKAHHFLSPPLKSADYDELGIKEKDTVRTRKAPPKTAPQLRGTNPDKHVIRLHISPLPEADEDTSAFKLVIRIGILPRDGKIPELTPHRTWYISKVPAMAEELPHVIAGLRRKIEDIVLSALESGGAAYISACWVNDRGEQGPGSEIIEVIIT